MFRIPFSPRIPIFSTGGRSTWAGQNRGSTLCISVEMHQNRLPSGAHPLRTILSIMPKTQTWIGYGWVFRPFDPAGSPIHYLWVDRGVRFCREGVTRNVRVWFLFEYYRIPRASSLHTGRPDRTHRWGETDPDFRTPRSPLGADGKWKTEEV